GGLYGKKNTGAFGCLIVENRAELGGGAYNTPLTNCIVAHNRAMQGGGRYGASCEGWHNTFVLNESESEDPKPPTWGKNNMLVWGEKMAGGWMMPQLEMIGVVTNEPKTWYDPWSTTIGWDANISIKEEVVNVGVALDGDGNVWWPDSACCDWNGLREAALTSHTGEVLVVWGYITTVYDETGDPVDELWGPIASVNDVEWGLQAFMPLSVYMDSSGCECDMADVTNGVEFVSQAFPYRYKFSNPTPIYGKRIYKSVPCPMVDPWNGDYRLLAGSEAIDAGTNTSLAADFAGNPRSQGAAPDLGALEAEGGVGIDTDRRRITVLTEGSGRTDIETATTEAGGRVTVTALDWGRPFLGWKVDGEIVSTNWTYTWENVTENGVLTAAFGKGDIWVDAKRGNDANHGSEAAPLATLQAAAKLASYGDTIRVKPGTYDRFEVPPRKRIDIIAEAGAAETVIDARWQGRCASLGGSNAKLAGFTLRRGCSAAEQNYPGEGAACYQGRLEDCIIENCGKSDGNTYFDSSVLRSVELNRCVVRNCRATTLYKSSGTKNTDTLVVGNEAESLWENGSSDNRNLTLTGNSASKIAMYDWQGGGSWYNCIVWGNGTANTSALTKGGWNCIEWATPREETADAGPIWAEDPQFVDAEHGDFRLASSSPYVNAGSDANVASETDLAGNPRIVGTAVDLGCYEGEVVPCFIEFRLGEGLVQLDDRPLSCIVGRG
ncbi:MAG: DUF1565 domain-containing protein, partial [Kiritimatiellae bacterium]|nr:DUF1565 domain-containing protein [Kiritimatiellia bacterium]